MEVKSSFRNVHCLDGRSFYMCKVTSKNIPKCELKFIGKHNLGMNNNHVLEVRFVNCSLDHIPQGLMKIFPNMEDLTLSESKIKGINKHDLDEYKLLKRIYITYSHIEFLPGDLFEGFNNLEEISFIGNKLKIIEPNILDNLHGLKHVYFTDNPKYIKCFSIYPEYNPNATLEEVKNELHHVFKAYKDSLQKPVKMEKNSQAASQTRDNVKRTRITPNIPKDPESQKGISNCVKNYIQDDRFKDFQIQIDDREFPVHKFLLAARSPTLAEMFLNNPGIEQLKLVSIPADIFETILKFLYTDEFPPVEGLNLLHLFAAAGRLKIEELKDFAATNFYDKINRQNALEVLQLSNKYEHSELKQKAFENIQNEYPKIRFKNNWANKPEHVVKIIEKFEEKESSIKMLEEKFEFELLNSD